MRNTRADPSVRSNNFYRHLGWESTGTTDHYGDEVLEIRPANARVREGEA